MQLPWCLSGKETICNAGGHLQCKRHRFNPWVKKTSWRRKWQLALVSLPAKSHGQRILVGPGMLAHCPQSGPRGTRRAPSSVVRGRGGGTAEQWPQAPWCWTACVHTALGNQRPRPLHPGSVLAPVGGNALQGGIRVPGCVWLVGGPQVLVREPNHLA